MPPEPIPSQPAGPGLDTSPADRPTKPGLPTLSLVFCVSFFISLLLPGLQGWDQSSPSLVPRPAPDSMVGSWGPLAMRGTDPRPVRKWAFCPDSDSELTLFPGWDSQAQARQQYIPSQ